MSMFRPEVPVSTCTAWLCKSDWATIPVKSRADFLRLMGWYVLQAPKLPSRKKVGDKGYCADPSGRDIVNTLPEIAKAACGDCKKLSMLEAALAIQEGAQKVKLCMTVSELDEEHVFVKVDGQFRDPSLRGGMAPRVANNYICVTIWPPEETTTMRWNQPPTQTGRARNAAGPGRAQLGPGRAPLGFNKSAGASASPPKVHDVFLLDRNGIPRHKASVVSTATTKYAPVKKSLKKRAQGSPETGVLAVNSDFFPSGPQQAAPGTGRNISPGTLQAGAQVVWVADGGVFDGQRWARVAVYPNALVHWSASSQSFPRDSNGRLLAWLWYNNVVWQQASQPTTAPAASKNCATGQTSTVTASQYATVYTQPGGTQSVGRISRGTSVYIGANRQVGNQLWVGVSSMDCTISGWTTGTSVGVYGNTPAPQAPSTNCATAQTGTIASPSGVSLSTGPTSGSNSSSGFLPYGTSVYVGRSVVDDTDLPWIAVSATDCSVSGWVPQSQVAINGAAIQQPPPPPQIAAPSALIPWVSTMNGGQYIWNGTMWVPNTPQSQYAQPQYSYPTQYQPPAPVYAPTQPAPVYAPTQTTFVAPPPPVPLTADSGAACEVQIVDQQAYRVTSDGNPPFLLGQYIGGNQVVLNGMLYNIDPTSCGIQFEGPYTGTAATLPLAQPGYAPSYSPYDQTGLETTAQAAYAGASQAIQDALTQSQSGAAASGLTYDPSSGYYYDQYGNVYDQNGNPVPVNQITDGGTDDGGYDPNAGMIGSGDDPSQMLDYSTGGM